MFQSSILRAFEDDKLDWMNEEIWSQNKTISISYLIKLSISFITFTKYFSGIFFSGFLLFYKSQQWKHASFVAFLQAMDVETKDRLRQVNCELFDFLRTCCMNVHLHPSLSPLKSTPGNIFCRMRIKKTLSNGVIFIFILISACFIFKHESICTTIPALEHLNNNYKARMIT